MATRASCPALDGPIGRAALAPHGVHAGGDADDAAKALFHHVAGHGVGHEEGAAEVDGNHAQPGIGDDIEETGAAAGGAAAEAGSAGVDAGVVDQDVEAAHLADGALHGVLNGVGIGDVGDDGQHAFVAADLAQIVGGLVEPVLVDVEHGDAGAGANQAGGNGAAHADGAGGAGHDGNAALQGFGAGSHGGHLWGSGVGLKARTMITPGAGVVKGERCDRSCIPTLSASLSLRAQRGNPAPVATTVAPTRLPRRYAPRNDKAGTHEDAAVLDPTTGRC